MSIFDKFKKPKDEKDLPAQAGKVVSPKETAQVEVVKKTVKKVEKQEVVAPKANIDNKESNQSTSARALKSHGILVRSLITEKATNLAQKNQYVFEISVKANKIQVAQAIEARYGVKPVKVNVLNNLGKVVRRGKDTGKTKNWKKAIVTLPEGKNIQIHEGV